ncbi:hypothetical protein [Rubellicoccus peritrichatus]|uniref:PEP-CTERM protein-sorting domain-containing protein n=1 Tax=Rubellicoccus peritrichatus TaxID=3080537 RepID=A0AAQ3QTV7_9BACT|nr:hypothetical protein [Puniceicoccus sp. CR14]WOO39813.1 hypothetical protein RZN69_14405 [Puniceicoccus sp. CR14]
MFSKEKKHTQATVTAAVSSLLAASNAQGIIQYFDSSNAFTLNDDSGAWDIDGNGIIDASVQTFPGYFLIHGAGGGFEGIVTSGNPSSLANLATNYTVSASKSFENNFNYSNGAFDDFAEFTSGVSAYFGFTFLERTELPNTVRFGWARATVTRTPDFAITIHEWAYEDTFDQAIQVGDTGAIPEPAAVATGLGALALGAAGLRRWRKAKQVA